MTSGDSQPQVEPLTQVDVPKNAQKVRWKYMLNKERLKQPQLNKESSKYFRKKADR